MKLSEALQTLSEHHATTKDIELIKGKYYTYSAKIIMTDDDDLMLSQEILKDITND